MKLYNIACLLLFVVLVVGCAEEEAAKGVTAPEPETIPEEYEPQEETLENSYTVSPEYAQELLKGCKFNA